MMHRSPSARARDRFRVRRLCSFRPVLEVLEDRIVPTGVSWAVDDDPAGTVFVDTNVNGVHDAGEPVLAGWTVWLDINRDAVLNPGEPVTTTDAAGQYFFDTTNVQPAVTNPDGTKIDFLRLDLPTGTGGRWLNTTATGVDINRTTTPFAVGVDFGVTFQPTVGVAPVGPESLVNVTPTGAPPYYPYSTSGNVSVSANAQGNYVVGWAKYTGGPETLYARVFNAEGSPQTGEIVVGTATNPGSSVQTQLPTVALAGDGSFVVGWCSFDNPAYPNCSAFARVFKQDGTPAGGPVTLVTASSTTTGGVVGAAADANGNFVVLSLLEFYRWPNDSVTLNAQRLTANGATNGKPITVTGLNLQNGMASVAMAGAGNFVVAWADDVSSRNGRSATYIYAQQYTAAGRPTGSLITVASGTTSANGMTLWPSVAMSANGRFVVTYEVTGVAGGWLAQIYNANGAPAAAAVTFASNRDVEVTRAAVTMDSAGNVTFAWTSVISAVQGSVSPYDAGEVRMRLLTAAGEWEPPTIVNTTTQGSQAGHGLAATGNGTFVVVWQGYGPGDPAGIFSQRYAPLTPQMPAGGSAPGGAAVLTPGDLTPIVHQAVDAWTAAGLAPAQLALLNQVQFSIQNLSASGALGLTALHSPLVLLDSTAEGWGWFVDATPGDSAEFSVATGGQERQALPGSPAFGRMDLLTVVEHELGHVLGLDDIDPNLAAHDLMTTTLGTGTRRLAPQAISAPSAVPSVETLAALFLYNPLPWFVAPVLTLVQYTSTAGSSQTATANAGLYSLASPTVPSAILDHVFAEQTWIADPFAKELLIPLW